MTTTTTNARHSNNGRHENNGQDSADAGSGKCGSFDPMPWIILDTLFTVFIPPLTKGELDLLEKSLLRWKKCKDPLIVWKETNILLDGHNRLRLCRLHEIPFEILFVSLTDRKAAEDFIVEQQCGKRNLSSLAGAYVIGRQYETAKKSQGGLRENGKANVQKVHLDTTAQMLGKKHHLHEMTVRRNGKLSVAVDHIAELCGDDAKFAILHRETGLRRWTIMRLAQMPADELKQFIEKFLREGKSTNGSTEKKKRESITLPRKVETLVDKLFERLDEDERDFVLKRFAELMKNSKRTGFCPGT